MQRQNTSPEIYQCFIQPGQVAYSRDPSLICAVCGNGVLVFLRDKVKRIGGVAHCVFPKSSPWKKSTNYHADVAIYSLVSSLRIFNVRRWDVEAQLFGGGHSRGYEKRRAEKVVQTARQILKKLEIDVVSHDTGGRLGRKIIFHTGSGEVIVQKTPHVRQQDWIP